MSYGEGIIILFVFLGFFALFGRRFLKKHARADHVRRIWQLVADRLGGRVYEEASLAAAGPGVFVTAPIDGVAVRIGAIRIAQPLRGVGGVATQITASAPGTRGISLGVYPEGVLSQLSKTFGAQDVIVGDDGFDDRYQIKASNDDLARFWLTEEVRLELERASPYQVELINEEIRATLGGLEDDAKRLERMARLVAVLSGLGSGLLGATRRVAAEIGGLLSARDEAWAPDGGVLIVVDRLGAQSLVDFVTRPDGVGSGVRTLTRVRARSTVNTDHRFVIHGQGSPAPPSGLSELPFVAHQGISGLYTLMTDDAEGLGERLSSSVRQRLLGLEPVQVTGDGREVTVLLSGVVLDASVIDGALDLAVELAVADPAGPYR